MTRSEREHQAKRIVQHYVNVANRQKKVTVNHFLQEQIPRPTIYSIIKKFEEFGVVGDKSRSGRPSKLSKRKLTRLKRLTDQKTGISLRQIAPKFDINISTLSRHLTAMGITYRKKKRAPKYTDKQLEEVPTRARRLYRTLLNGNFELVMDDEKYFLLHNESIPANRGFYTSDPSAAQPEVKFKRTQKFELKILVWIAISEKGISTPFFSKQQQAVTQKTYLNECTKARLVPFIEKYHNKKKVLFWPDLARSHYGLKVIEYLDENSIHFVPQQKNPQNCPQARPIETLWSILEQMVYAGGWQAKNINALRRRISKKINELDIKVVQTMFSDIRIQLRRIADNGPYGACSF
ncbi:unnamed protein product [Rotaria sordida]|uniref:Uncharacterized protein n=1 Tax=Rotaria sordida TaxID=392033 RepID=A0A816B9T7_9BILA|nr:unnamed protein product [Rotaria sordida]CAF1608616.1 unnamed protein product [Rotaria sordida]